MRQGLIALLLLFSFSFAQGQDCECLNCPQALPPPGPDSCQTLEFILNIKGAENDDLAHPFQGVCGLKVHFQHNYVWSLSMCLVSPGGDTIEFIGPKLTSGFASSAFSSWDIAFVQSSILPNPDPGAFPKWTNNQLWSAFQAYTGTYHPYKGELEDFNSGPVNGQWKILVKNCTELEKGTFINFSILFCDDSGIDCSCQAFAGNLNQNQNKTYCQGDPALDLDLHPIFFGPEPDTAQYSYIFIQSSAGVIQDYLTDIDLSGSPPGQYEICGMSFSKKDLDSIPTPDGMLTVSDLKAELFSEAPPFCGDITNKCLNINIAAPPAPRTIDTLLCSGQCFPLGDSLYCQSTMVTDTFITKTGCDSIVTLILTIPPAGIVQVKDTICSGEFFIVGNNFYSKTGLYQDTLSSPFTGCDSIVHLDLFVVKFDAKAVVQGMLDCTMPTVGISGIGSTFNVLNPLIQWIPGPGGNVVSGQQTLFALVNQPGSYTLKLSTLLPNGKVCLDSAIVNVQKNPDVPNLSGPSVISYCAGSTVNLNQKGFSDLNKLGGQLTFHSGHPLDLSTQIGPVVDPTTVDTVIVFYQIGGCTDTLSFTWTQVPSPMATMKTSVNICNATGGGAFNTLINFDTLILSANVVGSWSNSDGAPVGGVFPILNFNGVPGPASYTFTWTSVNATSPCTNITRTIEIFVENCACPSVATLPPGPFCSSDAGVDLGDYILTPEAGIWTLPQVPSGVNPATIQLDSLLVFGRDTGLYQLVFHLTNAPPPGCVDTSVHQFLIHAPPLLQLVQRDTLCNQITNGQWPTVLDLDTLIQMGVSGGDWVDLDGSGAQGSLPVLDFTGVTPGQYSFEYTTTNALAPCPEAVAVTEVIVLNCTCPPLQIISADTLCNDGGDVALSDFEVNVGQGTWSINQTPSGTNPAQIISTQLLVNGADTGHYSLVYALVPAPPGNCPQMDTLNLVLLSGPAALIQTKDTVCNETLVGNWSTVLDFQDLILSGDPSGEWSFLTPVPGATGMLPILDFTGSTPGNYTFIYGFDSALPPCLNPSYSMILTVMDCSCPTLMDVSRCQDEGDLDLNSILPPGLIVNWEMVSAPPGMNAAILTGSTLTTHQATEGIYYLKATWTNAPGDPCPDEAIVEVNLEALPRADLRPMVDVCNMVGPSGTPLLWMDSLFQTTPSAGYWSDIQNSGATGTFPTLDFTGVPPGNYLFVYETTASSGSCPEVIDSIYVNVVACACPPLLLSGPLEWCSSSETIALNSFKTFADAGTWQVTQTPAGTSPAVLMDDSLFLTNGDPGLYQLTFLLNATPPPGCPDSVHLILDLAQQPTAGYFTDTLFFCPGDAVDEALADRLTGGDSGGNWTAFGANPAMINGINANTGLWTGSTPLTPGLYDILYTVDATLPCLADTAHLKVIIHNLPTAIAGADQVLGCTQDMIILGDQSGGSQPDWSYQWSLGPDSLGENKTYLVQFPGLYVLTVQDQTSGCVSFDSVFVTAGAPGPSVFAVNVLQPSCQGLDGQLQIVDVVGGLAPYNFQLNQQGFGTNNTFSSLGPGTYSLSVQDDQGCVVDTTVTLIETNSFEVDLGPDISVPPGTQINLEAVLSGSAGTLVNVIWQPMNIMCPTCLTQTVSITETLLIEVMVENEEGCIASDEVVITIFDGVTRFFIPTAFSPNADGINDGFTIYGNELVSRIVDLAIFDRWGNQIFQGTDLVPGDLGQGWDGTYRGDALDPGIFIYKATLMMTTGQQRLIKGEVQLIK